MVARSMAKYVENIVHAPTQQFGHEDELGAQREAERRIEESLAHDRAARLQGGNGNGDQF